MRFGESITVLVASDARLVAERLMDRVSRLKRVARIDQMTGGIDALRLIAVGQPDVLIIDVHLENVKGLDLIREVKKLENVPLIISIAISLEQQYSRQSIKEGADYFFQLPADIDKLVELLEG